ncbi:hypothetical protein [Lentzea sp. NPDC059081]|uniref:hypothetical protein n=1 Tax=Lentzea sp. NPDC059081 TaxID=3346719 RepID=UPI0036C1210A
MSVWDTCADGTLVGVMPSEEITCLRSYATGYVQLAEYGLRSCSWVEGHTVDSGRLFPGAAILDERIMAIVRANVPAESPDWEIALLAPDCLLEGIEAAERVRRTLPEHDSVVVLTAPEDFHAWSRLIGDVLAAIVPYAAGSSARTRQRAAETEDWLRSLREVVMPSAAAWGAR